MGCHCLGLGSGGRWRHPSSCGAIWLSDAVTAADDDDDDCVSSISCSRKSVSMVNGDDCTSVVESNHTSASELEELVASPRDSVLGEVGSTTTLLIVRTIPLVTLWKV